jgi:hypothetical protein
MRYTHNEALRICLDSEGIKELMDFLRSCVINEFNQRKAFRVPVFPSSGLSARLRISQKSCSVTPKNISLAGIFVEFPYGDTPDLDEDSDIELTIKLESKSLTLRGIVRRREANGYGILFPECLRDGEVHPPDSLRQMVMELQRRWIKNRIK